MIETKKTKRLFLAINLPDEVRASLASVSEFFQHPALRWTPEQNLHITVYFIGMVQQDIVPDILQLTSVIVAETKPFTLTSSHLKVISKHRKPAMIWAAFEQNEPFENLARQLGLQVWGVNNQPVPHITLARIKEREKIELPPLPVVKKFSFPVQQIELWESTFGSGAPVYTALEKFQLGKP